MIIFATSIEVFTLMQIRRKKSLIFNVIKHNILIVFFLLHIMGDKCFLCGKEPKHRWFNVNLTVKKCEWCGELCCCDCAETIYSTIHHGEIRKRVDPKLFVLQYLCPKCANMHKVEMDKVNEAWNNACQSDSPVEVVSANYQGKKHVFGERISIESDEYEDREDALNELKALARYFNCDIIIELKLKKDSDWEETESGGEHHYSVWSYSGVATHKKKNKNKEKTKQ